MKRNAIMALLTLALLTLLFVIPAPSRPKIKISMQEASNNLDAKFASRFSLGLNRFFSSILWVQTMIESDHDHYKKNDGNSWMFHRFNTIATLDPNFYENYLFGGQYLSVIKDDDFGADIHYSNGLKLFPSDLWLNFYSGFHQMHELENFRKAIIHFKNVLKHKNAVSEIPFIITLTATLISNEYSSVESVKMIEFFMNKTSDPVLRQRYQRKINEIQSKN